MKISFLRLFSLLILLCAGISFATEYNGGGSGSGSGSSGYNTIENNGSSVAQRSTVNFAGAGVTCADGAGKTTCTIAGSATAGGSNTQVQYNASNALAGDAGMTYAAGTDTLSVGNVVLPQGGAIGHDSGLTYRYKPYDANVSGASTIQTDKGIFLVIDQNGNDSAGESTAEYLYIKSDNANAASATLNARFGNHGASIVPDGTNGVVVSGAGAMTATGSGSIKATDFSAAADLNAAGNITDFSNAAALDAAGNITDFSNAADLDAGGNLGSNVVALAQMGNNSVGADEIINGQVGNDEMADDAIDTDEIVDDAVDLDKLDDGSDTPAINECLIVASTASGGTIKYGDCDAVDSVFGRTGSVVAATNDYTWAQVDKSTSSLGDLQSSGSTSANVAAILSDETGTGNVMFDTNPDLTLETAANPTPTTPGEILYGTDEDALYLGDGSSTQVFYPGPHPVFGDGRTPGQVAGNGSTDGTIDLSSSSNCALNVDPDLDCDAVSGGTSGSCICTFNGTADGLNSSWGGMTTNALNGASNRVKGSVIINTKDFIVGSGWTIRFDNSTAMPDVGSRVKSPASGGHFVVRATGDVNIAGTIDAKHSGQPASNLSGSRNANGTGIAGASTDCASGGALGTADADTEENRDGEDGGTCTNFTWSVGDPLPLLAGGSGGKGGCTGGAAGTQYGFNGGMGGGGGGGGGAGCPNPAGSVGTCAAEGRGGGGVAIFARGSYTFTGTINTSGESVASTNLGGAGGGGTILIVSGSRPTDSGTYTDDGGAGGTARTGSSGDCGDSGSGGDGGVFKVIHSLG